LPSGALNARLRDSLLFLTRIAALPCLAACYLAHLAYHAFCLEGALARYCAARCIHAPHHHFAVPLHRYSVEHIARAAIREYYRGISRAARTLRLRWRNAAHRDVLRAAACVKAYAHRNLASRAALLEGTISVLFHLCAHARVLEGTIFAAASTFTDSATTAAACRAFAHTTRCSHARLRLPSWGYAVTGTDALIYLSPLLRTLCVPARYEADGTAYRDDVPARDTSACARYHQRA